MTMDKLNVYEEAFIVGLVMLFIFAIIHGLSMGIEIRFRKYVLKEEGFQGVPLDTSKMYSMMHLGGAVQVFLVGIVAHLCFEQAGINEQYCKTGAACRDG